MELGGCSSSSSSSSLCLQQLTALLRTEKNSCCVSTRDWSISSKKRATTLSSISTRTFSVSYRKFVDFALDETTSHTHLFSSPLQEKYNSLEPKDGKGEISIQSFEAAEIRLLRSLIIETETMQVLDFTVFPRAEYDVPIFCANFFTTARTNIVVLDLNPLHDVINQRHYKEKYFKSLIPLGLKYAELFPWGGKLTSESIKFFSPIVIWTKFNSSAEKYEILYSAFKDYYKVWLELVSKAVKETDESQISRNLEAQHRYLVWRAEKDPGQGVLKKLIGETLAKDLLRGFLFNGVDVLGSKTFNDYFPHYCSKDGDLNNKGSIIGKSFENRPWDERGEFLGEGIIP
ncbi:phytochromobilin:ferredoxin oxidoreductase, chloroplastic isoform X1 [Arachis duranensis]|uniref:Phytochromobilin:ferredoxin oxidoreductase, chloroplastic isoform X1 n=1 Tax=Arachis duranensis TaxID=130453 RepID=A0A6P4DS78_ARADU|nr:phytochromobilin:ferredoxin oxidoreductase, chloroplastic isoform X1 [Arachis duranensis]